MENENKILLIQSLPVMGLALLLLVAGISQCECSRAKTDDDIPTMSKDFSAVEAGISDAQGIVTGDEVLLRQCRSESLDARYQLERARIEQCKIESSFDRIQSLFDSCTE